eukprot:TRINITY_DN6024_c0_g1_i1.p2 TRINITY_DN6024_c0_g1~~TRINITY_DN6024_c0_g1_i1.p2  ORF type:complete len:334 (-),score=66.86 TRINITY_DN6024_c0_g1_i1:1157-2158(-)
MEQGQNTEQGVNKFGSANTLDRLHKQRKISDHVDKCLKSPAAKVILFNRYQLLVRRVSDSFQIEWVLVSSVQQIHQFEPSEFLLLGCKDDVPYYALNVSSTDPWISSSNNENKAEFLNIRLVLTLLSHEETAIVSQAKSFIDYTLSHKFCGFCGTNTKPVDGGSKRICTSTTCGKSTHPRTDPAVIMLIISYDSTKCLLSRQKSWPVGLWSCLAGFVEAGESAEDAVRRESCEEAGVKVGRLKYFGSQNWTMQGSQLMLGFHGKIENEEDGNIVVDEDELEQAKWWDRESLAKAIEVGEKTKDFNGSTEVRTAPPATIAYQLIKAWADQKVSF